VFRAGFWVLVVLGFEGLLYFAGFANYVV
jgi:hypothetical protein